MLREVSLKHIGPADPTGDWNFRALAAVASHLTCLNECLAVLAGYFDFGDDFTGDAGGAIADPAIPAARTVAESFGSIVDTIEAVYFGAALTFDCIFGKLKAERTNEVFLKVHDV